ncbi:MAG TPA: tetratricopeptide repeat protein [Candidatus Binatia bacterium]|nr:tetratricopeptide repeat protein [Candidatus Binatia bacterium]
MTSSLFEQYKAALRRGHLAALAGELEDALAAYDEAARLVPSRPLPNASRGTVLHRLDRWEEAAEAFDRALELAPDDEASLRARATARADRGLASGAAADFERLAFVLDVAGRAGDAAEAARRAVELEPTSAREALVSRLRAAAGHVADAGDGAVEAASEAQVAQEPAEVPAETPADDDAGMDAAFAAMRDRVAEAEAESAEPQPETEAHVDLGAYDALEALRAGMAVEEESPTADAEALAGSVEAELSSGDAEEAGAPEDAAGTAAETGASGDAEAAAAEAAAAEADATSWPGIDLPSPPPPPLEGPLPDPEELLAEAALVLDAGEVDAARDLMLTAVRVHREAGRIDAALDVCLNLLSIAPGDSRVHLAIANLQFDRGWTAIAKEKLDLLVRLTTLTGDTQAAADVQGLASERLRDDESATPAGR